MEHILIVDDEPSILTLLAYNLQQAGYQVDQADDGLLAYEMIEQNKYDFIILDVMLPGMDGMDICRKVRKKGSQVPILMLTAKDEEYDKVVGLELGADDYMTKPFSPREVLARIKAILRRTGSQNDLNIVDLDEEETMEVRDNDNFGLELDQIRHNYENTLAKGAESPVTQESRLIKVGELEIYPEHYEVRVNHKKVDITPKEFELLVYMVTRRGRILSREQLLNSIWDFDYVGETRIVDVHISHLREKIEDNNRHPKYIQTMHGFGYKFEVPE